VMASVLQPAELEAMRQRLNELPDLPEQTRLHRGDWLGAFAVFLLVFLSTFPVTLPFLFMRNTLLALRVSNAIAIAMLFVTGCTFGRITGRRPWTMGLSMVVLGSLLVGLTMALGG